MSGALCIRCGEWKQAPTARCGCGFEPAKGSADAAGSVILSEQFRTSAELEELAKRIRSGEAIAFGEEELRLAASIPRWNVAVNLGAVVCAALLGLLMAGVGVRLAASVLLALGLALAAGVAVVYALMLATERKIAGCRPAPGGTPD